MQHRGERYLIIGAGVSGLATARHFVRLGLPFDVVDRNPGVGGLWDWQVPGNGMYHSAHFISSKDRTAFPDFPMPAHYPDFPHNEQVLAYLRTFALKHNLLPHIEFEREVRHMAPAPEGGWLVSLNRGEIRRYAGVVLATGHFWDPVVPEIPGQFEGLCLHSATYKTREIFAGQRVLIVGLGNSACDIASDAVQGGAAAVTVSARSGAWIVPKYMLGQPADAVGGVLTRWLPRRWSNWLNGRALRLLAPWPARFGLPNPIHRFHERLPVVNSLFLYYIGHGQIAVRPAVRSMAERVVRFDDGQKASYDVIVYCTGYKVSFPFLDGVHLNLRDGLPEFYLHVFHPHRDDLYLVGIHEQTSGGWSMHDTQARMVASMAHARANRPEEAERAAAVLPKLHRRVRQVSNRLFSPESPNFAIQVEETAYKKAAARLLHDLQPQPGSTAIEPLIGHPEITTHPST